MSDHYGIFCVTDIPCTNNELKTFTRRDISFRKISKFSKCLKEVKWDFIHKNVIQEGFTFFQELFSLFFNQIWTKKTFNITYKNRLQWMTNKLRNQIKDKNALYIKSIKTNSIEVKNKYTTTKNKLLSELRNAEIEYFGNELELSKSDISKCWNVLKDIVGRNCNAKQRKVTFITDNGRISESVKVANEFNVFLFLLEIYWLVRSRPILIFYHLLIIYTPNSMVMSEVSPNEVLQITQSLKNSNLGWDGIPTSMAKQCVNNFMEPLTYLINKSFSSGICPIEIKTANVIPIFKSGDTSTFSNFRPILHNINFKLFL